MHNETRQHFNGFLERIAELNGVADATERFSVTPNAEQKLVEKIKDSHPFLQAINNEMVDSLEGEKIYVGTNNTIAGRTNTTGAKEREPNAVHSLSNDKYRCEKTDLDTFVRYATLDAWRHDPAFQQHLRNATSKQIGRDHLMIAFNGTSAATNTDRAANPLLQDVNIGFLERLRQGKASAVMSGVKIGDFAGADYRNPDAAVFDAVNELIEPWNRGDDLVVICGRKVVADKYFTMLNGNELPTERSALEGLLLKKALGTLPTITVPFFPDNAFMITPLKNLSKYTQRGTTRLNYLDNPKKDRIEEYRSVNECFVIEDYDACCMFDGILQYNEVTSTWE